MAESPLPSEPSSTEVIRAHPLHEAMPAPVLARPTRPLELPHISRGAAAVGVTVAGLLLVFMLLAAGVFEVALAPPMDGSPESAAAFNKLAVIDKWINAVAALGALLWLARVQRLSCATFGLHGHRFTRQLAWAAGTLGGVYAALLLSVMLTMILVKAFPEMQEDFSDRFELLKLLTSNDLLGKVLLLVPVAIHEEVVFRGLMIPYLRRLGCGWVGAIGLSNAVFAVLHGGQGWLAIPQIFFVGVALGVFYAVSRSLTAVMLAHFAFDLLQLQFASFVLRWAEQAQGHV